MNCKQCIHYEPYEEDGSQLSDDGRCKRYPPVIFHIEGQLTCDWPIVDEEQSCGEWSVKQ